MRELIVIRLPVPFELNHVNVALVPVEGGYMMIDTGMDTEECFQALETALAERGIAFTDIRRILLTHMHPDHVGLSARLRALTGAEVAMHGDEIDHLNSMIDAGGPPWVDAGLAIAGTPPHMIETVHRTLGHLRHGMARMSADIVLQGGEEFLTDLGPARIVWTPGHSVGHVCVYFPERRLLYSADHMIEKITPNICWLPDHDTLGDFIASLNKMRPFEIDTIVPSHGEPFHNHVAWIEETIRHHEERCDALRRAVAAKPATAHHLLPVLWDRHLTPFHYYFGLFEVMSHLEYMRVRGRIAGRTCEDGSIEWSA